MNDMDIQTFTEQIAVEQARHHQREQELLQLLNRIIEWENNHDRYMDRGLPEDLLRDIEEAIK